MPKFRLFDIYGHPLFAYKIESKNGFLDYKTGSEQLKSRVSIFIMIGGERARGLLSYEGLIKLFEINKIHK